MKKYSIIISSALLLLSCKQVNDNTKTTESSLLYISEERVVYYQNDSITIHPFEQFNIVKLDAINNEMFETLEFSIKDTLQTIRVLGNNIPKQKYLANGNSLSICNYKDFISDEKGATITFKTYSGKLSRRIEKGNEYKIIYCYKSDSEVRRTNVATDDLIEGYYIVDILPLNEKFERENH
jgi:hypothetical protein